MKNAKPLESVLFYVEPRDELGSEFRLGAMQDALFLASLLREHLPNIDIALLTGESMQDAIQKHLLTEATHYRIGILNQDDLDEVFGTDIDAADALYHDRLDVSCERKLIAKVHKALGEFTPQIIYTHETSMPFMRRAYPQALTLHTMYGMSYRAPYPRLTQIDPQGLYGNALLLQQLEAIKAQPVSDEDRQTLGEIRGWFARQIVPHDPTWPLVEPLQTRFDRLILLPLQVDGYYAFNACSDFKNQVEFLEAVMAKIPENWGVIVTEHDASKSIFDDLATKRFLRRYPNLVISKELMGIKSVSQALMPHVDALVTVSSSLGLQSLIYDIPVIAAGWSHINAVATVRLEEAERVFDMHRPGARDAVLHFLLSRYWHLTPEAIHTGAGLTETLMGFWTRHQEGAKGLDLLPPAQPLHDVLKAYAAQSQWRVWRQELEVTKTAIAPHPVLNAIAFADAVSFDLFDTLVDRPFVEPHELFHLLEFKVRERTGNIYFPFQHLRRESERLARAATGHQIEVTLDEIYKQLEDLTGLEPELIAELKDMEVEAELQVIAPRRGMGRLWSYVRTWGKPRSILTDIYLEEDVIKQILNKCGFGEYDLLYVSATEKVRKEDGTVFPYYVSKLRQERPEVRSMLHIGDNPRADGEMARRHGLSTCVIPKAMDQLRATNLGKRYERGLVQLSVETSMPIALAASRQFGSVQSFFQRDSATDGDLKHFGYSVLGPMVLGYTQWVVRRIKALGITKPMFLARDGYLVMKVYEALRARDPSLPAPGYLLCSRRSVAVPAIKSLADIRELATLNFGSSTLGTILNARYGLEEADVDDDVMRKHGFRQGWKSRIFYPRDLAQMIRFVSAIEPQIMSVAERERQAYVAYLRSEGLFDDTQRIGLIDIGYSGTMQRKIQEMTGRKYDGLYMLTHNYVLHHFRDESFEAWLEDFDSQRAAYRHAFNDHIPLLESLLSSPAGSLLCFKLFDDDTAIPEMLEASNETDRIAFLRRAHAGAMTFVSDWHRRLGAMAQWIDLPPQVATYLFFNIGATPTPVDIKPFEGLLLENAFAGAEFSVIANPLAALDAKGKLTKASYDRLVAESKWKQAAAIALRRYLDEPQAAAVPAKAAPAPQPVVTMAVAEPRPVLTTAERRRRKLYEQPAKYFADARFVPFRLLKYAFGPNWFGRMNIGLLRKIAFDERGH